MIYAERIKQIRNLRGYTQLYVAHKMGISQQSYSSFEIKAGDKTISMVLQIATILDVDVCLIFATEIPINSQTINMRFTLSSFVS
jgi:transcriptional regulator with XRE-family HTH domain